MKLFFSNRFGINNLLFWLSFYLVASPFFSSLPYASYIFQASLSAVVFFGVYVIYREEGVLLESIALMIFTLALHWLDVFEVFPLSDIASYVITSIYFGVLAYSIGTMLIASKKVSWNLVSASLCLYLIIGIWWGTIYALLQTLAPGSFSGTLLDSAAAAEQLHVFVYFSFITLTTLGYGDITPQTMGAGALCQAEAVFGQLFIAVVVAALVGMRVSQQSLEKETAD